VICAPGYDDAHRVWDNKGATLAKYGLPRSMSRAVEDDDLIPVCAGADNANPLNHWPQACASWQGTSCVSGPAHDKDEHEWRLCRLMCDDDYRAGKTDTPYTPAAVQAYFRSLQWAPKP
jgi:hypothetical protein